MPSFKTAKGTELPLLNLKGKPYLQVAHRIIWFREEHPDWTIKTEIKKHDDTQSIVGSEIIDDKGRTRVTGHKKETAQGFGDHLEKAETGAIGRALALLGFGTQFAEADFDEGERIVDSPITPGTATLKPMHAAAATSFAGPEGFIIPFGKNKGQPISVLNDKQISNDLSYWNTKLAETGEKPGKQLGEFLNALEEALEARQRPPADLQTFESM